MDKICRALWIEAKAQVAPEKWRKYCDHTHKLTNAPKVKRIVIPLGPGEASSDSDEPFYNDPAPSVLPLVSSHYAPSEL